MQILSHIMIHSKSSLENLFVHVLRSDRKCAQLTQPYTITSRKLAVNVIVFGTA